MILDIFLHVGRPHPGSPKNVSHCLIRGEEKFIIGVKKFLPLQPPIEQPENLESGDLLVLVDLEQLSKLLGRFPHSPPWSITGDTGSILLKMSRKPERDPEKMFIR